MSSIAGTARGGALPETTSSSPAREIGMVAAWVAFVVFTVWINYAVRYAIREGTGTVAALGDLEVGAPAPSFTLDGLDGDKVSLESMRGEKTVLIEFWASWCPPCRMVLATLRAMEAMAPGPRLAARQTTIGSARRSAERARASRQAILV